MQNLELLDSVPHAANPVDRVMDRVLAFDAVSIQDLLVSNRMRISGLNSSPDRHQLSEHEHLDPHQGSLANRINVSHVRTNANVSMMEHICGSA